MENKTKFELNFELNLYKLQKYQDKLTLNKDKTKNTIYQQKVAFYLEQLGGGET